jgi:hypothetical protein
VEGCHKIVEGVGSIQQIRMHNMPCSECGRTLSMKMQKEDIYPCEIMVGTPSTPKWAIANTTMLSMWKTAILFVLLYNLIDLLLLDRNVLGKGCSGYSDFLFTS